MFDVVGFLVTSILEPAVFLVVGAVVLWGALYIRRRRNFLRRILPFETWHVRWFPPLNIVREQVTVTYGLIPPEATKGRYFAVEEGDVAALNSLVSLMQSLYGHDGVDVMNCYDAESRLHDVTNLVTLSGPLWNRVTELYLGRLGSPATFELWEKNVRLKVATRSGEVKFFTTTYGPKYRPTKCYGLVVAGVLGEGRGQGVLLLAGSSNLTTYGSSLVLLRLWKDRSIRRQFAKAKLWKSRRWAFIFSVENWAENQAGHSEIPPIKTGVLNLKIERIFTDNEFLAPYDYHFELR